MVRRLTPFAQPCCALLLLLLPACEAPHRAPSTAGLEVGKPAPKIEVDGWVDGAPPPAEELKGKVVVVDAWASWCRPCREKAPEMVRVYKKFHSRGVVFIGLTSENAGRLAEINQFLKETGITWPNGYGATRTLEKLQVVAIPAVWVIGRDGKVAWNTGSKESLEAGIEAALSAERGSKTGE